VLDTSVRYGLPVETDFTVPFQELSAAHGEVADVAESRALAVARMTARGFALRVVRGK
jgi:hypothetical protein